MKKILLIEDEKILAEMYKEKFKKEGFKIHLAFDTKEGLEMTREERPDLVLLDILLPKENGISYLRKLREDPKIAETLVVALSNYDEPKTRKEAFKLGLLLIW